MWHDGPDSAGSEAEVAGVLAETADGEAVTEATGHGTVDRDAALECARTAGV